MRRPRDAAGMSADTRDPAVATTMIMTTADVAGMTMTIVAPRAAGVADGSATRKGIPRPPVEVGMRGDRIARADGMMMMTIVVDRASLEAKVKADGSATHAGTPRLLAAGGTSAGRLRV